MAKRGERSRVFTGRHVIVDFEMDWAGIARCAMGPELHKAVTDVAEHRAKPYAISISPRSTRHHQHYQDSFTVKTGSTVINEMMRVAARLWNLSEHAVVVEFGNANANGHRVLARTIDYLNGPIVGELASVRLAAARVARRAAAKGTR